MSTKAIREALEAYRQTSDSTDRRYVLIMKALDEVEAIEKAARSIVEWNKQGRPAFYIDAARGYDVLERIAKETGK
jgi:hypothetical protein